MDTLVSKIFGEGLFGDFADFDLLAQVFIEFEAAKVRRKENASLRPQNREHAF